MVGAGAQGFAVAGLLVGAVAVIAVVNEEFQSQFAGDLGSLVGAAVVHQNDEIDHVARQIGVGHVERLGGVVRRHDHHDFGFIQDSFRLRPCAHDELIRAHGFPKTRRLERQPFQHMHG